MVDDVERAFDAAMVAIYTTAKRDLGYNATRFLQMVTDEGGLGAARRLLHASSVSDGFTTLWEHARLDLSVEAHVLRPEFAGLFTNRERQIARRRLKDYGFDGDLGLAAGARLSVPDCRTVSRCGALATAFERLLGNRERVPEIEQNAAGQVKREHRQLTLVGAGAVRVAVSSQRVELLRRLGHAGR